jgi:AcrR family transcriptional regulator
VSRRKERQPDLLSAAVEVFARKGYHASTVSDIIAIAGVARGTFYLYFKSKRDVFARLLTDLFRELEARVQRLDERRTPQENLALLRTNIRSVMAFLAGRPALLRILLWQATGSDAEFDSRLSEFYRRLTERVRRSLRLGVEMGLLRPMDIEVASLGVLGAIKEVLYRASLGEKLPAIEPLVDEVMRFIVHGLFVPGLAASLDSIWTGGAF